MFAWLTLGLLFGDSMSNSTLIYKCPCCDAGLIFDPDSALFKCEFCLSKFTQAELEGTDASKRAEQLQEESEQFCSQMNEYHCPSCGAEIIADEDTAADFCYYCHNPVVLAGKLSGYYAPSKVIPFKYSKEEAMAKFEDFAKRSWFVPNDFKSKAHIQKIKGIYFPFWVTDAITDSQVKASCTKVRSWYSGDYKYTETSYFDVLRRADIAFEDIVNSAYLGADKEMLEGVLPYPSDAYLDFNMSYLSGFNAKKRDIERADLAEHFKNQLLTYGTSILRSRINGYSTTSIKDSSYKIITSHWDYSLLPVWILTYKNKKGKTFTYAMNGYTGKIYGQRPMSPKKVAIGSVLTGLFAGLASALPFLIGALL